MSLGGTVGLIGAAVVLALTLAIVGTMFASAWRFFRPVRPKPKPVPQRRFTVVPKDAREIEARELAELEARGGTVWKPRKAPNGHDRDD